MDPDTALSTLRAAIPALNDWSPGEDVDADSIIETAAEAALALDHWLSKGGFLPKAWRNAESRNPDLSRSEHQEMIRTHAALAGNSLLQAEKIADHYAANASLAMDLLAAVNLNKTSPSPELESFIDQIAKMIATHHRIDLGLELSWPTTPSQP